MATWFSSKDVPCCVFPCSHSLKLSPHSQQQSLLRDYSPIPTHQLPATMHTDGYTSLSGASLVAQTEKNLPVMQETQVQSLCQEDLWEEGIATHCFSSSTSSSRSNCAYSVPPSPFFLLLYPVMHAFISSFPVIETSASIYSVL